MKTAQARRSGFTLLEVLLVVAILAVLAGAAITFLPGLLESSKKDTTGTILAQVDTALGVYATNIGHYPTQEEGGLQALRVKPTFSVESLGEKWTVTLQVDPVDSWGKSLNYQAVDASSEEAKTLPYKLWSNGPNGTDENGEGDDIKNKAWKAAK